jgi:hypothetical protein
MLSIYECRRSKEERRHGAVLIAAPSKTDAFIAFLKHEGDCRQSPMITRWECTVCGEARVLYDDKSR